MQKTAWHPVSLTEIVSAPIVNPEQVNIGWEERLGRMPPERFMLVHFFSRGKLVV